jgi:tRNA-modifying protein YgfZ
MTGNTRPAHLALLPDRGIVSVSGEDAAAFLDNLITNDLDALRSQPSLFAALLSPQGKILFEFLIVRHQDGYLLETQRDRATDLVKRLSMYKLRAKVTINDLSSNYAVIAAWRGVPPVSPLYTVFPDPRLGVIGWRLLMAPSMAEKLEPELEPVWAYHAHRIALGVPEGGKDYPLGDTFPHEANYDRLAAVSFSKGCYVGQEVVARMENKTVVRRRVVPLTGMGLEPGAAITIGDAAIGTVGSVHHTDGLALVRLDRAAEGLDKGQDIMVKGARVVINPESIALYRQSVADKPVSPL